jgi:hypothetical protein
VQLLREIDSRSDISRIVKRPVVDPVVVPWLADSIAVQVCGDHDVLTCQSGFTAWQKAEHIVAAQVGGVE